MLYLEFLTFMSCSLTLCVVSQDEEEFSVCNRLCNERLSAV